MARLILWMVGVCSIVGCQKDPPPPAAAPATPAAPAPQPAPVDAGVVDASSPDAAVEDVPDQLADAPPWVFRRLYTGAILSHEIRSHVTYTLRRHGELAMIDVETRPSMPPERGRSIWAADVWGPPVRERYIGTARTDGKRVLIDVRQGAKALHYSCVWRRLAVASPGARRDHSGRTWPDEAEECGDTGAWYPRRTTRVATLDCTPPPEDEYHPVEPFAFARSPGIEYVWVNDDCAQQGGGLRRVDKDGRIQEARRRSD